MAMPISRVCRHPRRDLQPLPSPALGDGPKRIMQFPKALPLTPHPPPPQGSQLWSPFPSWVCLSWELLLQISVNWSKIGATAVKRLRELQGAGLLLPFPPASADLSHNSLKLFSAWLRLGSQLTPVLHSLILTPWGLFCSSDFLSPVGFLGTNIPGLESLWDLWLPEFALPELSATFWTRLCIRAEDLEIKPNHLVPFHVAQPQRIS